MHLRLIAFITLIAVVYFARADDSLIRLSGDERIVVGGTAIPRFLANAFAPKESLIGSGQYCVSLAQAEPLQQPWQVRLFVPEQGFVLRPSGHSAPVIPFDVRVKATPTATSQHITKESVISRGESLVSHCGNGSNLFHITIQPTRPLSLIKAGHYRQRLRLQLTAGTLAPVNLDIPIVLEVPELVQATLEQATLSLPPFDGRTVPAGFSHLCLFRNGGGRYSVAVRGDGALGQFTLQGTGLLSYQVFWQTLNSPMESLQPGQQSQTYAGSSFRDCQGGHNATVHIQVPVHEAQKASSGRYQGRLKITVRAQ